MTYFKVIENGAAVDAGQMWLQWNERHGCLMACEPREAHYAQSYDGETIYRFGWLNLLPDGAPSYPVAEASIIDAQEYEDLMAVLPEGETVPEPPEPGPEPGGDDTEPEPGGDDTEPEHPMTIAEMRQRIRELEEALNIIMGVTEA